MLISPWIHEIKVVVERSTNIWPVNLDTPLIIVNFLTWAFKALHILGVMGEVEQLTSRKELIGLGAI